MSGLAEVLLNLGFRITGSDIKESEITRNLSVKGAICYIGHSFQNITGADVVVVSSAIGKGNVEIEAAKAAKIPIIPRAEMLAELMRMKQGIAIAGTHGKTTTTSLISHMMSISGFDPTVVIGGRVNSLGSNAKLGRGEYLVAEADESDGSFLKLNPTLAVVTTLDEEHLDYYADLDHIKETFLIFINKIPFYGLAVLCLDQKNIRDIVPRIEKRYLSYGLCVNADLKANEIKLDRFQSSFRINYRQEDLGQFHLNMPGIHNICNSLAALGIGLELGIDLGVIRKALDEFSGIQRRFQLKGYVDDIMVIDDYGHHPAEIRASLRAAKDGWPNNRLIILFQPHRYTRTRALLQEFGESFDLADTVIVTKIYSAGEQAIPGIRGELLAEELFNRGHKNSLFISDDEDILTFLNHNLKAHDILITLGAGDVHKIGESFLSRGITK